MKARALVASMAIVIALSSVGVEAFQGDGNQVLSACRTLVEELDSKDKRPGDLSDRGYCFGVMDGVLSLMEFVNANFNKSSQLCIPDDATKGQLARIIVKWLKDNPKSLSDPGGYAAYKALQEAYPCES